MTCAKMHHCYLIKSDSSIFFKKKGVCVCVVLMYMLIFRHQV